MARNRETSKVTENYISTFARINETSHAIFIKVCNRLSYMQAICVPDYFEQFWLQAKLRPIKSLSEGESKPNRALQCRKS